jgi:hypothetical protein
MREREIAEEGDKEKRDILTGAATMQMGRLRS